MTMKAINKIALTVTVFMFALSASAQQINSNQGKSWPKTDSTAEKQDNSDLELTAEELGTLEDQKSETKATSTVDSTTAKSSSTVTSAPAKKEEKEISGTTASTEDIEDEADIATIDNDLEEIDDLLATDGDETEYEVLETRYVDGQPVTQAKRVSKSELEKIVSKKRSAVSPSATKTVVSRGLRSGSRSSSITTKRSSKVIQRGKPHRRVVRRVLRRRISPNSSASSSRSSKTSTTVVKTRTPVIKKKVNKRLHITPVIGASYGRIEGNHLTNRYQNSLESDFGLTGGALIEYRENDWLFGFETGVVYNQTTVTGDMSNSQNQTASLDYMMNEYLMFPVTVKFYPLRAERFKIFALAGVAGGVLLDSNFQQTNFGTFDTSGNSASLFKDGEFQWHVGAGANFRVTDDFSIAVESKFYHSFDDITDSSTNTLGGEAYNVGLSTYAGLVIHL